MASGMWSFGGRADSATATTAISGSTGAVNIRDTLAVAAIVDFDPQYGLEEEEEVFDARSELARALQRGIEGSGGLAGYPTTGASPREQRAVKDDDYHRFLSEYDDIADTEEEMSSSASSTSVSDSEMVDTLFRSAAVGVEGGVNSSARYHSSSDSISLFPEDHPDAAVRNMMANLRAAELLSASEVARRSRMGPPLDVGPQQRIASEDRIMASALLQKYRDAPSATAVREDAATLSGKAGSGTVKPRGTVSSAFEASNRKVLQAVDAVAQKRHLDPKSSVPTSTSTTTRTAASATLPGPATSDRKEAERIRRMDEARAQRVLDEAIASEKKKLQSELKRLRHTQIQVQAGRDAVAKSRDIPDVPRERVLLQKLARSGAAASTQRLVPGPVEQSQTPPPSQRPPATDGEVRTGGASPDSVYLPPAEKSPDAPTPNRSPSASGPPSSASAGAVSILTPMELRAKQRAESRALLKQQQEAARERMYAAAMAEAEAEEHCILDQKRKDAAHRRKLREEAEAEEKRKLEAIQRKAELNAMAKAHARRGILKWNGFAPWRRFVLKRKDIRDRLQAIECAGCLRLAWRKWSGAVVRRRQETQIAGVLREMQMIGFVKKMWLRDLFGRWLAANTASRAQYKEEAVDCYRRLILRRWRCWALRHESARLANLLALAERHESFRCVRKAFSGWLHATREEKAERQRAEVRSRLWSRAQAVLSSTTE